MFATTLASIFELLMRQRYLTIALLLVLALPACASHQRFTTASQPMTATAQTAKHPETFDAPRFAYNEIGKASWYGHKYHGRRTASGRIFDMNAMTAAHPSLPFGTTVTVTNLENGRSAELIITDRGPFAKSRILDVSYRAAQILDFVRAGTTRIQLQTRALKSISEPVHSHSAGEQVRSVIVQGSHAKIVSTGRRLSCVPYARQVSGIRLMGDAWVWWQKAPGRYQRGHHPTQGAILVMSRSKRLRRGHLAVVSEVLDNRNILVTQANWLGKGEAHKGMPVVDVSANNDWSKVRVWYKPSNTLGIRRYDVAGFVYPQQP